MHTQRHFLIPAPDGMVGLLLFTSLWIGLATLGNAAESGRFLWQIGQPDNNNREFALAPNRYSEFREDGFFAVGRSEAGRDWPYVHPGPQDDWAGGRPHTFSIMFSLKSSPASGECRLRFDLLDTHSKAPPELQINLNGRAFRQRLPAGAGDASIFGQPAQGKEDAFDIKFPADLLKAGANEIAITTLSGSWILYDWIGLETPAGLELADTQGTVVSSTHSPPVLVERDGQLMQTVQVALRHIGEPLQAVLSVNDIPSTNLTLRIGSQSFEVPVAAVDKESPVTISVEAAGKSLARQTLTLKPVRKWIVYLLPHSHVDIGYTHVQTDVERAQWKYLELAMETARRTASYPPGCRFKWNVEVLWAVDGYLQQASPEQRQAFYEAVRAGQVGLDALYGNMLTGLCRPEELLRLLRAATELSQRTGVPVESAMITDVPGYTWGMVPALAQSGVKYFSIGPNGGDRIGHTIAAWGDKPFWWLGPNNRDKILVWMTGTDYLARLEERNYPYDMVQVRHCLGDNGAPDVNFADRVKAWNDAHAYPKLVIATTAEMFRDFEKRYGERLPTAQGDFTPYWEDGAASSARETALNRASAERLVQAETLFAMLNPDAYPLGQFYRAWRNVVLYDEHTWGAHNSISQPDHPFVKSQWAIKQAFALDADKQSRQLIHAALAERGQAVPNAVDIFNPSPVFRDWDMAVIPKEWSAGGNSVAWAAGGAVSSQRLSSGELIFLVRCIPGFGARRYQISPDKPSNIPGAWAEGNTITNQFLALRVDPQSGAIVSLRLQGKDIELVDAQAKTALNDYFYLPGSDLAGLQSNGPVKISVKEGGPVLASLLIESEAPGCRKLTREIQLVAPLPRIHMINTVDKAAVRTKEGVHFGFGFNIPGGVVRMDVPWGVVRPETDQIPGACKNWFTVQRWVDISNDKYGVTWTTPDAPLLEIGGITANLIGSLSGSKLWLEHIEPSQTIYSWAMNNHWHTNYRAEQDGSTVFRYSISFHPTPFSPNEAAAFGIECSQPLIVAPAQGELPTETRLQVKPSQVLVTAFKPSDDGKAWIVRLFGAAGKDEKAHLRWAAPAPKAVWLSDNSERPSVPVTGPVTVPAWSIVTLRADR
jgi:alpha-mannosidase